MLERIVYSSQATRALSPAELEHLLTEARNRNGDSDITGALVFVDGVFMQILEGEREALARLMEKITGDSRHCDVKVFHRSAIESRAFDSWRMAYLAPDAEEVAAWADLDGSITIAELLADVQRQPQRLPRMLEAMVQALADG